MLNKFAFNFYTRIKLKKVQCFIYNTTEWREIQVLYVINARKNPLPVPPSELKSKKSLSPDSMPLNGTVSDLSDLSSKEFFIPY